MKTKWKGALIGGTLGLLLSILFYFIDLGTSVCVKGLNFINFFCSVNTTLKEFGFLAMVFAIPRLLFKNLFNLDGMQELFISPLMALFGILIGALIAYLVSKKNEK